MSPTLQMASPATYTPTSDAMDRHEYGISKNRKPASTGGGRAWSDDEEVYLLQTRLQKMPYKHIAAHLKKTELACRLHYHQLSHGSNRRKRTTSVSSGSSTGGHSPILAASMPSPIHEHGGHGHGQSSPTPSPPGSSGSFGHGHGHNNGLGHAHHHGIHSHHNSHGMPHGHGHNHSHGHCIHLPSINTDISNTHNNISNSSSTHNTSSPRLPTILPKPVSMNLALATGAGSMSSSSRNGSYMGDASTAPPHSAPLLPAATFSTRTPTSATTPRPGANSKDSREGMPNLRLDCSGLPPLPLSSTGPHHPVDMARLHAVYAGHRTSFWSTIAGEYGRGSNPLVLEQAWRTGGGGLPSLSTSSSAGSTVTAATATNGTPLTPDTSPDEREAFYGAKGAQAAADKTRISSILGIDANPRSPKEREMVRRLEEERVIVPPVA
ncbi:hypothetical protein HMPREF1624_05569 [Sporothrix schenckii ATCC 58251]|uniref:Myb-like domain-containing protein n=1 Tax=Sporothrix schenckii (strain ATCC 58251 / de Perez 2211183) TaxID=1391915 RepID=U7PPB3_SPOS1|nr:hypothetical protein HMPREF1624_05569 [Sporothrix schenckii ATCC 58251]